MLNGFTFLSVHLADAKCEGSLRRAGAGYIETYANIIPYNTLETLSSLSQVETQMVTLLILINDGQAQGPHHLYARASSETCR